MGRGWDKECVVIEICAKCEPCNGSFLELFEEHAGYLDENVIYCDFFFMLIAPYGVGGIP